MSGPASHPESLSGPPPSAPGTGDLEPSSSRDDAAHAPSGSLLKLSLGALGIVFGDIGTSPLYAMRECFHGPHGVRPTPENVLGVLSLVFWALTIIISLKYVAYVLRADNKGEGGVLALVALSSSALRASRLRTLVVTLGVLGAALLYGEGAITPAISVLSAVEGLNVALPGLSPWFLRFTTVVILVGLFSIQRHGTGGIGVFFGPVMLAWFLLLGALGLYNLSHAPFVLSGIWPSHAIHFLAENGLVGFGVLGAVFLVVTGGEALYADLGHFGRKPIRLVWFTIALPALFLNYLGQGALLLNEPYAAENPFFRMMPAWALLPGVLLSTVATVIASQALIAGAYSLTRQGTMLGLLPRIAIRHTSEAARGQIYVPSVNWLLMIAAISLVLGFGSSSALASAYGIAVSMVMVITTIVSFVLVRHYFRWGVGRAVLVTAPFLAVELAFVVANGAKIETGGWFPLVVGAGLFTVMTTWQRGRELLAQRFREQLLPLEDFFDLLRVERPARVPGTAVLMTSSLDGTPPALLYNFLHNRVVHKHVVLLTIFTDDAARVSEEERTRVETLPEGFVRVLARYGFMEQPDVPKLLIRGGFINASLEGITFFLGRETMIATEHPGMARWRALLFAFLSRNAQPATKFFRIPPDRVMEIGAQIEL
ncbi:MAG: potassium transporter Kup [Pseudomonadota bacterium]